MSLGFKRLRPKRCFDVIIEAEISLYTPQPRRTNSLSILIDLIAVPWFAAMETAVQLEILHFVTKVVSNMPW